MNAIILYTTKSVFMADCHIAFMITDKLNEQWSAELMMIDST